MNSRALWHLAVEREGGGSGLLLHLSRGDQSGDELHEEARDEEEASRLLRALEPASAEIAEVADVELKFGGHSLPAPRAPAPQGSSDEIVRWGIEKLRSGNRVRFLFRDRSYEDIRAAVQDWRDATRPSGGGGSSE